MPRDEPVAIVGVGALFPGSSDADGFWRDIVAGRDLMRDVPPSHWSLDDYYDANPQAADRTYGRRGAFLDPIDFDPMEFGIPPANLPATDSAQLLALVVARQVLDDAARGRFAGENRDRISVILGVASTTELVAHMAGRLQIPIWQRLLSDAGIAPEQVDALVARAGQAYAPWQENTFPGLLGNVVAGRIANRFDLGGTNTVVDAACASSLSAVHMALGELHLGHSDLVVTGGVDALNDVLMYMCFSQSTALSPTGDCRPFSDQADGTMLGEGVGMVALKRLADAERDGDPIYAVIRGLGTSSDGRARSIYAPRAEGQVHALRRCYERAGFGPATVELVEAHGTATAAGDAAEVEALRAVFEAAGRADRQWCALGSVKSQIGHTKAAAGIAGLLKATLALHHKVLPPTLKVARPNPTLDLPSSPFYLNTTARPWIRTSDHPRRASVSSFGFGGTNFHVALEEYVGAAPRAWRTRVATSELFPISADDSAALALECERVAQLAGETRVVSHLARRVQADWNATRPARLAIVSSDASELCATLHAAANALREGRVLPAGVAHGNGAAIGDVAFLFPGQGSQYVGMGADLAMAFDCARAVWDRAADLLQEDGTRLDHVVFPRPALDDDERGSQRQRLTATEWAQPAVGAHSLALLAVLRRLGLQPTCVAGHSFGELTALHAAGVMEEADYLRTARVRGESMAQARGPGAMTAVALEPNVLRARVTEWPDGVVVANHNSPTQTVLSGPLHAIEDLERRLAAVECASVRLPVSGAFHSALMDSAVGPFRAQLDAVALKTASCPVYSNVEAACYAPDANAIRRGLTAQLTSPVRFAEQVESMYAAGMRIFVEVGPQDVLTRLVGKNLKGRPHLAVSLDRSGSSGMTALWQGLALLAAAGIPIDFATLWEGWRPEPEARAERGTRHTVPISGANYGKPRLETSSATKPKAAPSEASSQANIPVPVVPVPATAPETGADWLRAVEAIQRATADAHETYQRTLTESHNAFLAFAEQSLAVLAGAPLTLAAPTDVLRSPVTHDDVRRPTEVVAAQGARPEPVTAAAAASEGPPTAPIDVAAALLEIVAEHTGYPQEMLQLHMELESDLGIDSIKRVEILAALEERWPGLALGPERIAAVRTLADVVDTVNAGLPFGSAPTAIPSTSAVVPPVAALPATTMLRAAVRVAPAAVAAGLGLPALRAARRVTVIDGGSGLGARVAAGLAHHGCVAAVVETLPADADALIALAGLQPVTSIDDALALNRTVLALARDFARAIGDRPGAFVAVQDSGGDFGASGGSGRRAWAGGFGALVKTLMQELPAVGAKAIDIAAGTLDLDLLASRIVAELWSGGPEVEVGIGLAGQRVVVVETPAALTEDGLETIDANAVVVASGGARGVTAAALLALARRTRARFALLGRSPLPEDDSLLDHATDEAALRRVLVEQARATQDSPSPRALDARIRQILAGREVRATLAAFEATGAQVRYLTVDVRDAAAVHIALADVRQTWGPITALVHGAGALGDALLRDKTDDAFARVLDTKLLGLRVLLDATQNEPLSHLVLFSSIAARMGNAGQSDYALANAVLAQVAAAEAQRRGATCRVRALLWGPLSGGMVTDTVAARMRARGIALLDVPAGADAFVREMSSAATQDVAIVLAATPAPARAMAIAVGLDPGRHPYLSSHVINGRPVLPLALVLEWLCRHVRAKGTNEGSFVCRDLRVLRGVTLENDVWASLHVRAEPVGADQRLTVMDGDGQGRFQGRMTLSAAGGPATDGFVSESGGASWNRERIYADSSVLFHGPAFQVLDDVRGMTRASVNARVRSTSEMGWPDEPWTTDPAAVEGCLQLAVLWAAEVLGVGTLPMCIAEYEQYARTGAGPLRCALRARVVGSITAAADVRLFAADGMPLADLRGIELVARPS